MNDALLDAAQDVMDTYYQDFKTDDAFFDIEDFAAWLGKVYADEADKSAKLIYQTSRSELGMGYITFSDDWVASKIFPVKVSGMPNQVSVPIDINYLGFEYDMQNSGIQDITEGKSKRGITMIRTTQQGSWKQKHQPLTDVIFWYVSDGEIVLNSKKSCYPKEIKVFYIPTADDDNFKLPSSKAFIIAQRAWGYMKQAQSGTVVDMTNNQNSNATAQTEIDTSTLNPKI